MAELLARPVGHLAESIDSFAKPVIQIGLQVETRDCTFSATIELGRLGRSDARICDSGPANSLGPAKGRAKEIWSARNGLWPRQALPGMTPRPSTARKQVLGPSSRGAYRVQLGHSVQVLLAESEWDSERGAWPASSLANFLVSQRLGFAFGVFELF